MVAVIISESDAANCCKLSSICSFSPVHVSPVVPSVIRYNGSCISYTRNLIEIRRDEPTPRNETK